MTTVRQWLEYGYPEHAMTALREHGGETPLCCYIMERSRITCGWLGRPVAVGEFERFCLRCQEEMMEKLRINPCFTSNFGLKLKGGE